MSHRVRIIIRWSRPLRRGLAATLSGVVISLVSLLGAPPQPAQSGRHVEVHFELHTQRDTSR